VVSKHGSFMYWQFPHVSRPASTMISFPELRAASTAALREECQTRGSAAVQAITDRIRMTKALAVRRRHFIMILSEVVSRFIPFRLDTSKLASAIDFSCLDSCLKWPGLAPIFFTPALRGKNNLKKPDPGAWE